MTRERTAELLPVMEAWANGKAVQFAQKGQNNWSDVIGSDPNFDNSYLHFRIKPRPRERWIVVWVNGREVIHTRAEAEALKKDNPTCVKEIFRVEEKEGG